jgi:hypothetical protein
MPIAVMLSVVIPIVVAPTKLSTCPKEVRRFGYYFGPFVPSLWVGQPSVLRGALGYRVSPGVDAKNFPY